MSARQIASVALLAGAIASAPIAFVAGRSEMAHASPAVAKLPVEGQMPSFAGATGWLNSPPLKPSDLRGKVVLVNVCTYSCINWLRQLPYVRAWAKRYGSQGLVVIGVHSPEFGFEKDVEGVSRALTSMAIEYPVIVDNDHAIWRAFDNDAWPALYFVDAQGRIRGHHYGEGAYEESERALQQLLADAGHGASQPLLAIEPKGVEAAADWANLRTGETYVGFARTENFASPGGATRGKPHTYSVPARMALNHWALAGEWTLGAEATVLDAADGRIAYRFHARDLHLVMGPRAASAPVRFRVLLDGHAPGTAHGLDVDAEGYGTVKEHRLHQLIRQAGTIEDRAFEIQFLDAGVETFSFTFG